MKVLENLTEKVLQTGQKVSDKVKDANDTMELNNDIARHEAQILEIYAMAGKLVIEHEHTNSYNCVTDDELRSGLIEYGNQIADVKMELSALLDKRCKKNGMAICKECGSEVSRDMAYCPKCGAHIIL